MEAEEKLVPYVLSAGSAWEDGVLTGHFHREPVMVPPSVLEEAQVIRAEGRELWAKATEGMPHNEVADRLCVLLNRIDALEREVPHDHWSNAEGNAIGEDLRHPIMDLLGAEYEDNGGWLVKCTNPEVFVSNFGDSWIWIDESEC